MDMCDVVLMLIRNEHYAKCEDSPRELCKALLLADIDRNDMEKVVRKTRVDRT